MIIVRRQRRNAVKTVLIIAAVAGIAVVLGLPAQAQPLNAGSDGQVEFNTPSGNIGCIYTPAGGTQIYATADGGAELQCDRVEPDYARIVLGASDEAYIVADLGEASCCSIQQVLGYGQAARFGPFECRSEQSGLTCMRDGENGFFIRRAGIDTW